MTEAAQKSGNAEAVEQAKEQALTEIKEHRRKAKEINDRMAKVMEDAKKAPIMPELAMLKEQFFAGPTDPSQALPGRQKKMKVAKTHYALQSNLEGPWPEGTKVMIFANGCFWGSEKGAWRLPGVYSTAAGYAAGWTPNPNYGEACSGRTGCTEAVQVVYDPSRISLADILRWFWQSHDPTQGNGQGGDRGTQYRSGLYYFDQDQKELMEGSRNAYRLALRKAGKGRGTTVTTEIKAADEFKKVPGSVFYYAEDEHQQYLAKPGARQYCGAEPQGVPLPAFSSWAPAHLQKEHVPRLSEAFWERYSPTEGCVLGVPDEQIRWPPAEK